MDDQTHAHWVDYFGELAREYWTDERTEQLTRGKKLLVLPGEAPILLRALGLLHRDATMPPYQVRKYLQINHMLWVLGPPLRELMGRFETLHFVDAGCGRSYLTVVLAWVFEHVWQHDAKILGVDRNEALIEECRRRTELTGLQHVLRYEAADLGETDLTDCWRAGFGDDFGSLHALISLHACDTATDDAIALACAHGAELIAVAPCCQAELARGWQDLAAAGADGPFSPVWSTPHLCRETAATVTDTMRMLLLRAAGYETRAVEFVDSAHTPKNTLLRAIRRSDESGDRSEYESLKAATGGIGIKLEGALG